MFERKFLLQRRNLLSIVLAILHISQIRFSMKTYPTRLSVSLFSQ